MATGKASPGQELWGLIKFKTDGKHGLGKAAEMDCPGRDGRQRDRNMSNSRVTLETTAGNIEIELMPEVAPLACENFSTLVEQGFYDGLVFHRVIKSFMIQGGDPTGTGKGGESIWGSKFRDECDKKVKFNKKGRLAMANAGPNTNGSQFFITTAKTQWLHMKHTIFGEVASGYDSVKKLEKTKTDDSDRPLEEQKIIKAILSEA